MDRDRIIYTKAFKRLEYKTQVYLCRLSDHFRTRLTHSLEVSQISREFCRNLKLNEDLAEAISMAHDIGHTAFGHSGEEALNNKLKKAKCKGFCHNENAVRVIIAAEEIHPDWNTGKKRYGINPTHEVAEGALKHSNRRCDLKEYKQLNPEKPSTLEGQAVAVADEIAQRSCDLYDALHMNIITQDDINDLLVELYGTHKVSLIKEYFLDIVNEFLATKPENKEDLLKRNEDSIKFSKDMKIKDDKLKSYLDKKVYQSDRVKILDYRGKKIIETLYDIYNENICLIPTDYRQRIEEGTKKELVLSDYISGMTDRYAIMQYETLFGTLRDPC